MNAITKSDLPGSQVAPQVLAPLITACLALTVYLATMAPGVTWANHGLDGGELITASVTLGVPHPPGYPTYILISNLFGRIPLATVAYRYNLFSALCAAIAAGFVAAIAALSPRAQRLPPAQQFMIMIGVGLSFAFMPLVWGQATITEVYTLNLAFLAAFLWVLLAGRTVNGRLTSRLVTRESPCDSRVALLVGALLGLSITTHLSSLLMLPLALGMVPPQQWIRLAGGLLLGLLPFLAIPFLASGDSPVVWGAPTNLSNWWRLISAQLYRPNVFALPNNRWLPRLWNWSNLFITQFAWLELALIVLAALLRGLGGPAVRKRNLLLLLTVLLYALYAFGYNTPDALVYFLPGLLLLSIFLAEAFTYLRWGAVVLPTVLLVLNFANQNLHQDQVVSARVEKLFDAAPQDALLLTAGDQTVFALWYYHHVEGRRPDIVIVDENLFAFDWYRQRLADQYPEFVRLATDDLPGFKRENRRRPQCEASLTAATRLVCAEKME